MKKHLVLIMVLLTVALSLIAVTACDNDKIEELEPVTNAFYLLTDTHVVAQSLFTAENYSSYVAEDKMEHMSEAILNTIVDSILDEGKVKTVLVAGDLSGVGDEVSALATAAVFKRLESGGVNVWIINGNHDVPKSQKQYGVIPDAKRFKEIYADFGYTEALSIDPNSLSYTADIDDNFRLFAIDNMTYYTSADTARDALTDEQIDWIEEQLIKCKVDGKTPIAMAHCSVLNHLPAVVGAIASELPEEQKERLLAVLTENGCRLAFSGHNHAQDVADYVTQSGVVFTEVQTSSTMLYPCAYRKIEFTATKCNLKTVYVDNLKEKYLSDFCTREQKIAATTDFRNYCYNHMLSNLYDVLGGLGKEGGLMTTISVSGDLKNILDIAAVEIVDKVFNAPFYKADETEDYISLERIMESYGLQIINTPYKNLVELVMYFYSGLNRGDENFGDTAEIKLLKYAVFSIFYYIDEASNEFKTAFPDWPQIDIDVETLFKTGNLECYNSNFIPFVLLAIKDTGTVASLLSGLSKSLAMLASPGISKLIEGFTSGIITSLKPYVGNDENYDTLYLGKLIEEGLFGEWAFDFVSDVAPADNNYSFNYAVEAQ